MCSDVAEVHVEESQAKANILLLSKVDASGRLARNLLLNALRQTGQLQLANLLDEERRIKAFTGSGAVPVTRAWCKLVLGSDVKLCVARHSTKFVLSHSFETPTLFVAQSLSM